MATQIIKDVYSEYLSGSVVVTPPASNIEFIAGAARGGELLTRYTISDKDTARQIFRGVSCYRHYWNDSTLAVR